ncbi:MAG TPA: hypothetical protein DEP85_00650 [Holosporales bacterium]|nr:hypothetical protein [Holosporales bacterium]
MPLLAQPIFHQSLNSWGFLNLGIGGSFPEMLADIKARDFGVVVIPTAIGIDKLENLLLGEFKHINQMFHKKGALVPLGVPGTQDVPVGGASPHLGSGVVKRNIPLKRHYNPFLGGWERSGLLSLYGGICGRKAFGFG